MSNTITLKDHFAKAGGILSTAQLKAAAYSDYDIAKLLEAGEIERIRHGWYRHIAIADNEWAEVSTLIGGGVFCLHSAAQVHNLSTFVSGSYQVAIPWKKRIRLPSYPPIQLYYWKDQQYTLGQTLIEVDGRQIPVYDAEKTVCDFLKARNKVGFEATKEVTTTYAKHAQRDLTKLMRYAKTLGISSVAQQYFSLLV
jgi:predicted transcriptional regulator of viral defense system